jgi:hypothetical protein
MAWAPNDATLVTAAGDGGVYEWEVPEGKRTSREYLCKGARIAGMAPSQDGARVYLACERAGAQRECGGCYTAL